MYGLCDVVAAGLLRHLDLRIRGAGLTLHDHKGRLQQQEQSIVQDQHAVGTTVCMTTCCH